MSMFEVEFEKLQLNKLLVLLRSCCSQWQKSFIKSLERGRAVVDLADPIVREQALSYPEDFIHNMAKPTLLYNLQKVPELLPLLAKAEATQRSFVAVTEQSHYLLDRLDEQGSAEDEALREAVAVIGNDELRSKLAIMELPLEAGEREPFVPDSEGSSGRSARKANNVLERIVLGRLCRQEGSSDKQYYTSFVKRMVRQQIMEQTTVSDDIKFYRFLGMAASMTGTVVFGQHSGHHRTHGQAVAAIFGRNRTGVSAAGLGRGGRQALGEGAKLYSRDTGMAAALLQLPDAASVMQSVDYKNFLKTTW